MKLISKFKDGYDIYARNPYLSDQSWNRAWQRDKQAVKNPLAYPQQINSWFWKIKIPEQEVSMFTIFFCGIEIPVIMVRRYVYSNSDVVGQYETHCFYNFADFSKSEFYQDGFPKSYFDTQNRIWERVDLNGKILTRLPPKDICLFFRTPIVIFGCLPYCKKEEFERVVENGTFCHVAYLNPCLKDFEFFTKYMDAFTAFQMLERFICNDMVVTDMKDVKISDVLKAETHGFNKYSFRKDKLIES